MHINDSDSPLRGLLASLCITPVGSGVSLSSANVTASVGTGLVVFSGLFAKPTIPANLPVTNILPRFDGAAPTALVPQPSNNLPVYYTFFVDNQASTKIWVRQGFYDNEGAPANIAAYSANPQLALPQDYQFGNETVLMAQAPDVIVGYVDPVTLATIQMVPICVLKVVNNTGSNFTLGTTAFGSGGIATTGLTASTKDVMYLPSRAYNANNPSLNAQGNVQFNTVNAMADLF